MSSSSKTRRALARRSEKRKRKSAQRAKYEAFKLSGQNSKSKRSRSNERRRTSVRTVSHRLGPCGNIGCRKCSPWAESVWRRSRSSHVSRIGAVR